MMGFEDEIEHCWIALQNNSSVGQHRGNAGEKRSSARFTFIINLGNQLRVPRYSLNLLARPSFSQCGVSICSGPVRADKNTADKEIDHLQSGTSRIVHRPPWI